MTVVMQNIIKYSICKTYTKLIVELVAINCRSICNISWVKIRETEVDRHARHTSILRNGGRRQRVPSSNIGYGDASNRGINRPKLVTMTIVVHDANESLLESQNG